MDKPWIADEIKHHTQNTSRYGGDMSGLGAARADWNAMLLKSVAADAYVALLDSARTQLGSTPAYAALWPSEVGFFVRVRGPSCICVVVQVSVRCCQTCVQVVSASC